MERGDLSLEDSVSAYERGVVLHRYCERALSTAERKIRILTEGAGDGGQEEALQLFRPEAGDARTSSEGGPAASAPGESGHVGRASAPGGAGNEGDAARSLRSRPRLPRGVLRSPGL